jgi:O-antigen ligase
MRNKALWIIMLFTLWIVFTSLLSPVPKLELVRAFSHFQLMLLVLITYWILETNGEKAFIWVLRSYIIGSLGMIIITFITGAAMQSMTDVATMEERYGATLGKVVDQNMMAALIAMAFLAAIYLFARDKNISWRVIYLIAIGFLPIMVIRTGSRSCSIALVFTLVSPLLFIRQVWRRPTLIILLLLVIILALGALAFFIRTESLSGRVHERLTNPEEARQALSYRMSLNQAAIRIGFTKLTGTGQFRWFEEAGVRHHPHSDFFLALGFYGIPGAMLFTFFVIMMMLTVKRFPLGVEKLYARAILTFLLVMGLGINQLAYKYFWMFIATIMVMERISWFHSSMPGYIAAQPGEGTNDVSYQLDTAI